MRGSFAGGLAFAAIIAAAGPLSAAEQVLTAKMHHLRLGKVPEWSEFPVESDGAGLKLQFKSAANAGEWTLRFRQQDVKQTWKVQLNGKELGRLIADENDQVVCWPLPAGTIVAGENTLSVEQANKVPDDIRVGEMALIDRPVEEAAQRGRR